MPDNDDQHGDPPGTDTHDTLEHAVDFAFSLPMMLVMNFAFAVYFWNLYSASSRLQETRVQCLVLSAWISFICLVGFAYASTKALLVLNDLSESTIMLTFLAQVTIITRDATNLCNLKSLHYFMRAAEVLSVIAVFVVVLDIVTLAMLENESLFDTARTVNQVLENVALAFIVSFRFYYILLSRGSLHAVIQNQPGGTLLFVLLVGHEYPFMIARTVTSAALEYSEGVCMRALLLICIWYTTREKQAAYSRRRNRGTRHTTKNRQLSTIVPCGPGTLRPAYPPIGQDAGPSLHMRKLYQRQTAAIVPTQSATVAMSSMMAANSRRSDQRRGSHQGLGIPIADSGVGRRDILK
jgi:hypothetical protein